MDHWILSVYPCEAMLRTFLMRSERALCSEAKGHLCYSLFRQFICFVYQAFIVFSSLVRSVKRATSTKWKLIAETSWIDIFAGVLPSRVAAALVLFRGEKSSLVVTWERKPVMIFLSKLFCPVFLEHPERGLRCEGGYAVVVFGYKCSALRIFCWGDGVCLTFQPGFLHCVLYRGINTNFSWIYNVEAIGEKFYSCLSRCG